MLYFRMKHRKTERPQNLLEKPPRAEALGMCMTSEMCRHCSLGKEGQTVPVLLGLGDFPACETFSGNTRKFLYSKEILYIPKKFSPILTYQRLQGPPVSPQSSQNSWFHWLPSPFNTQGGVGYTYPALRQLLGAFWVGFSTKKGKLMITFIQWYYVIIFYEFVRRPIFTNIALKLSVLCTYWLKFKL